MTDAINPVALVELCERLDEVLVEESPMHPFGCATWEEASRIAIDMAKAVIQAKAARIAELEGALRPFAREADTWSEDTLENGLPAGLSEQPDGTAWKAKFSMSDLRQARSLLSARVRGDCAEDGSVPSVSDDRPASHGEHQP